MHTCMSHGLIELLRERADDVGVESFPSVDRQAKPVRTRFRIMAAVLLWNFPWLKRSTARFPSLLIVRSAKTKQS